MVYDRNAALEQVDGDGDFLKELAEVFLETTPEMLNELAAAVERGDTKVVGNLAHAIKGSLGNFCAHPSFESALRLERIAREGDAGNIKDAHHELVRQVERLNETLEREVVQCQPSCLTVPSL